MSSGKPTVEDRARALAERTLRGAYIGNPARHAELASLCWIEGVPMPRLLAETEIMAEVDRDWPIYAALIERGEAL